MQNKAIKFRIEPNRAQRLQIVRTFGCCRFVYNRLLDEQEARRQRGEKSFSKFDADKYCTQVLKPEFPWLREADKFALSQSAFALVNAYQRFFSKHGQHPRYKSKHKSKRSYTTVITNTNIAVLEHAIKLPKLGYVKAKIHRRPPDDWTIKSATVSMDGDGKYYVSILFEYDADVKELPLVRDTALGLDFKANGLYADSNGDSADMPKWYKDASTRLARKQRQLSRKRIGSSNYRKSKKKVTKLHKHVANQRNDFLHKQSAAITKQYDTVCVEDLSIKKFVAERPFRSYRKSVMDNGWYNFTVMLDYKLRDRGGRLVKVDKHFPSSQLCSICGELNPALKDDHIRRWICPHCGAEHDRDVNAAINIKREGLRILAAS